MGHLRLREALVGERNRAAGDGELGGIEDDELGVGDDVEVDGDKAGELAGGEVLFEANVVAFGDGEFGEAKGRSGNITYGDGSKSKVMGQGTVEIPSVPTPQEVLYVEGLKANLLSISQFCDNDLVVQFSKEECSIFDAHGKWLMGGDRTSDNCYGITPTMQTKCHKTSVDIGELWHQRLGHLNYHDLIKIAKKEVVSDLPKLNYLEKGKCGPCQLGKQTRNPHKKTSGIRTTRTLELLHMDLMGPTRTASLGGKKYILVVVDDYSRYTWIRLLKEKSEAFDQATILFKQMQVEQDCLIQ
jgi:hypothetical protein